MKTGYFFSKVMLFTSVASVATVLTIQARTWHLVNGKTMEGDIVEYTEDGVIVHSKTHRKKIRLKPEHLLKKDHKYLKKVESGETEETIGETDLTEKIEESFAQDFPKMVSANSNYDIEIVKEEEGKYVYRSPNFEFISNAKLTKMPIKRFALLFEATREYMKALPLAFMTAHKEGKHHKIYLFETKEQYVRAGGSPTSAGVFFGGKGIILVPFESLGLIKAASGYRIDYKKQNNTLSHEIVHQLTDRPYYAKGARGWFTEGLADYVAVTKYRAGKFLPNTADSSAKEYATAYGKKGNGGLAIGENITMPHLEEFMNMSYDKFLQNAKLNYAVGTLMVTYYIHYDGSNGENLKNFMRALRAGKSNEEAHKALFGGKSYEEAEEDLAKGWRSKGIKFNFQ